jgi:putative transposase
MKNFYRRNLPHWQPAQAIYFVTISLIDSIPKRVASNLQSEEKSFYANLKDQGNGALKLESERRRFQGRVFQRYDYHLDKTSKGPHWLKDRKVAKLVVDALHFRDQKEFDLYAFCVMSNHIHIVFELMESTTIKRSSKPVTKILKSFKSYTGLRANKILGRQGPFWNSESYDHVVRNNQSLERIIKYTLNNPVKANLVSRWQEWPYSYVKPLFRAEFDDK